MGGICGEMPVCSMVGTADPLSWGEISSSLRDEMINGDLWCHGQVTEGAVKVNFYLISSEIMAVLEINFFFAVRFYYLCYISLKYLVWTFPKL